jgi:hypothetical protein
VPDARYPQAEGGAFCVFKPALKVEWLVTRDCSISRDWKPDTKSGQVRGTSNYMTADLADERGFGSWVVDVYLCYPGFLLYLLVFELACVFVLRGKAFERNRSPCTPRTAPRWKRSSEAFSHLAFVRFSVCVFSGAAFATTYWIPLGTWSRRQAGLLLVGFFFSSRWSASLCSHGGRDSSAPGYEGGGDAGGA